MFANSWRRSDFSLLRASKSDGWLRFPIMTFRRVLASLKEACRHKMRV